MENDDSPMQEKKIDDPNVTNYTLIRLDHNSHYRFYLRGRTAAGNGEALKRDGATTLEGGKTKKTKNKLLTMADVTDLCLTLDILSA